VLHVIDARFLEERRQYGLRHTCDACVHFDERDACCGEGYPNEVHLRSPEQIGEQLCFCKSFELL
jgi:hypothetical protein